jgi:2-hydroxycyclohexanecarboxyl-CoA dehydrogenase
MADDSRALVTGGASGIGKATARAFSQEGARVAVCDIDIEGASALAAEIGGIAVELDVTDTSSVRAGVAKVVEELGSIDTLVNSAGWDRVMPFVQTDEHLWDRVIAINYRGVVAVTHAVLPHMIEAGAGAIVNIASEAGRSGSSGEAVYSGAKAAIIAFTRAVAREVARYGIRANVVLPGLTDTPLLKAMIDDGNEKLMDAIVKATPLRRLARPEEVAEAVLFLASERASFTTGETLSVGGGLVMA